MTPGSRASGPLGGGSGAGGETCRIYLITPPRIMDPAGFGATLDRVLEASGAACLQIRLKDLSDDDLRAAIKALMPVAHAREVAVVINDRPDLAAELGADGVHIGQGDTPYAEARRLVGAGAIVGVTCHDSRHLAMEAAEAGADYVAFGAFFPTETKVPKAEADVELLRWWNELFTTPSVAIGGITAANCAALVHAGADFLAVSSAVWNHPSGPVAGAQALNDAVEAALRSR